MVKTSQSSKRANEEKTWQAKIQANFSARRRAALKFMSSDQPAPIRCTRETHSHPFFCQLSLFESDTHHNEIVMKLYLDLVLSFIKYWRDTRKMPSQCLQSILDYIYVIQRYAISDYTCPYRALKQLVIKEFPSHKMCAFQCNLSSPKDEILLPTTIPLNALMETLTLFYNLNSSKTSKINPSVLSVKGYWESNSPDPNVQSCSWPHLVCDEEKATILQLLDRHPGYSLSFSFEKELPILRLVTFPHEWTMSLSNLKDLAMSEDWGQDDWILGIYLNLVIVQQFKQQHIVKMIAPDADECYGINIGLLDRGVQPILMVLTKSAPTPLDDSENFSSKYLFLEFRVPSTREEAAYYRKTYPLPSWDTNSKFDPSLEVSQINYDHILRSNEKRIKECLSRGSENCDSLTSNNICFWFSGEIERSIAKARYDPNIAICWSNSTTSESQYLLPMYYDDSLVMAALLSLCVDPKNGSRYYKVCTTLKLNWAYADARSHGPLDLTWLARASS